MIFSTAINGIPCKCKVLVKVPFDYVILDNNLRPDPWINKHIKPQDVKRLQEEYVIMLQGDDHADRII